MIIIFRNEKYRRDYGIKSSITRQQLKNTYTFDHLMHKKGYLKPVREGGRHIRNPKQIRINDVQGKIAEYSVYNFLCRHSEYNKHLKTLMHPTLNVMPKDQYDIGYDLRVRSFNQKINIEVKSSSFKAKSLMLEFERWGILNNRLVDHDNNNSKDTPNIFFMVNVNTDKITLKGNNDDKPIPESVITGVLFKDDLFQCIKENDSIFTKCIPTSYNLLHIDAPNYVFPFPYKYCVNSNVLKDLPRPHYIHYLRTPAKGLHHYWKELKKNYQSNLYNL